jgi:hypothetical protein
MDAVGLLSPPALREGGHCGLAGCSIAVRRRGGGVGTSIREVANYGDMPSTA